MERWQVGGIRRRSLTQLSGGIALCTVAVGGIAPNVAASPLSATSGKGAATARGPKRAGDVLRIFDRAVVYVVTNDDPALADTLLAGCNLKERRVLTVEEWRGLHNDIRRYVSPVFLVNRQRLKPGENFPERCQADKDELYTEITRYGTQSGVRHEVIFSASDSAWLAQAVADFRLWTDAPRGPVRRNMRSLALVVSGPSAARAATALSERYKVGAGVSNSSSPQPLAHIVPADLAETTELRRTDMDEWVLVNRSEPISPEGNAIFARYFGNKTIGLNDTVAWKERKAGGRFRVVVSAPTEGLLREAVRKIHEPSLVSETLTVIHSARDLRQVRRIAVAVVKDGPGGAEMARRVSSKAAMDLRSLEAFEVLERAGLSEILGEIALGQAGITKGADRAKVRQMAAADALLIVELTDVGGRTEYTAKYERTTPKLGRAPSRPLEPSRLKAVLSLPGMEDNKLVRVASEALLSKSVGEKSDDEYKQDINRYNRETLPRWERERAQWEHEKQTRPVAWRQVLTGQPRAIVSGSVRLVDLADGLVLWETPFTGNINGVPETSERSVVTRGEDSQPTGELLPPDESVSESLLGRAADEGVAQAVAALRGSALLPSAVSTPLLPETPINDVAQGPLGRILDKDGDSLLVGLGAGDGIKLGDTLLLTLPDGQTARLTVTRVRPRTCDAKWEESAPLAVRAHATVEATVRPEKGSKEVTKP